jgi:uncharacterized protein (DUF2147 family)
MLSAAVIAPSLVAEVAPLVLYGNDHFPIWQIREGLQDRVSDSSCSEAGRMGVYVVRLTRGLATNFNAIEESRVFESGRSWGGTIKTWQRRGGEHMAPRIITALAGIVAASMMTCSWPASAAPVEGAWAIHDLILEIYQCQNFMCGRVAWVKDPHRRKQDCGRTIVWGLSASGPETWSDGSIYDTTDGNTYRLNATLNPDGTLHARIFRGIPLLGKTEILRRVEARSQPGWCSA